MQERTLHILYGSQTGTAEDIAKRIRRMAKQYHFNTIFAAMNDFPVEKLPEIGHPVIFVCSTTGQGEEPDNMKSFWRSLLRRRLPPNSLTTLQFAVLGLGDSSYQYFNFPAKRLHKRLLRLGGSPVTDLGLADDQHELGIDGIAEPWIKTLLNDLLSLYPLPEGVSIGRQNGPAPPSYTVEILSENTTNGHTVKTERNGDGTATKSTPETEITMLLTHNERITAADHFQDVRFMKFEGCGVGSKYVPGDVACFYPENSDEAVDSLLDLIGLKGETLVHLTVNDEDAKLPPADRLRNPCTIREAAKVYWDFQAVPRKSFFELLVFFAVDEREQQRLREFASPEGTDELYSYCFRPKRTILEVLEDFSDTRSRVPLAYWFDLFRPIQLRSFSIASSPSATPNEIHLLVAVVKYQTKMKKPRLGLCSNWLASLPVGTSVQLALKKGTMKFDKVADKPVIMVGPGTGVAPYRSFINERAFRNVGNSTLFFGCRFRDKDYYFESEWDELTKKNLLTLCTAISREQEEKVYVQHLMRRMGEYLYDAVVERKGYFYVAGNSKNMPADVMTALKEIIVTHSNMGVEEADAYINEMVKENRYQTETWG